MRVVVHPVLEPEREIDVTERLVATIAEELWRLYGGSDQLNWLEAEAHLRQIVRAGVAERSLAKPPRPRARGRRATRAKGVPQ